MMKKKVKKENKGIRIASVFKDSAAYAAGLRKNDYCISVNGESVEDDLDFSFHAAEDFLEVVYVRNGKKNAAFIERVPGELLGIDFVPMKVKRCRNKCVFCFIDQMPPGLRKSLYVKDEDYRYSFLNGNYITLTSITQKELERVITLGLSPLYISVHAVEPDVRRNMLCNRNAGNILDQLNALADAGISFHTQLVICPGYNDGAVLTHTLNTLLSFSESLLSVAVVPVGLTKHRKKYLEPFNTGSALELCHQVLEIGKRDMLHTGRQRVFLADEFFIKARLAVPGNAYYEDYPQIENGVGLLRLLMNEWETLKKNLDDKKRKLKKQKRKAAFITSRSACPTIEAIAGEMSSLLPELVLDVVVVENSFFGESVTVAGLLTARDILKSVKHSTDISQIIFIPKVIFNYKGYTLDGYSFKRMKKVSRKKLIVAETLTDVFAELTR